MSIFIFLTLIIRYIAFKLNNDFEYEIANKLTELISLKTFFVFFKLKKKIRKRY